MKKSIKIGLVYFTIFLVLLYGTVKIFDIFITVPSKDLEFNPGAENELRTDHFQGSKPKNIILFIADGFGFGHLSLAMQTQQAQNLKPIWNEFPVQTWHDPRSIYGSLTDSEASATAISTGTSTNFGHIGIDIDGKALQNVFEIAQGLDYKTGIVTDSYIWDATPAAFTVHIRDENDARGILDQLVNTNLDLIFGELEDVGEDMVPEKDETLEILKKRFTLLDEGLTLTADNRSKPIAAIYEEDEIQDMDSSPNLKQLTEVSLDYLTNQEMPFFLLVESEEMDAASHQNNSGRVIKSIKSIQETLTSLLSFAKNNKETLLIFTSDHETGGMSVVSNFNNYPNMQLRWSTKDHSAQVVPFFAIGPGSSYFQDIDRNWEIGQKLKHILTTKNDSL